MTDSDLIQIAEAAFAETGVMGDAAEVRVEGAALVFTARFSGPFGRLVAGGMADAATCAIQTELQFGPDFALRFAPPFTPERKEREADGGHVVTLRWRLA